MEQISHDLYEALDGQKTNDRSLSAVSNEINLRHWIVPLGLSQ